jgi:multidrug transporter EmrE-like cation transporter
MKALPVGIVYAVWAGVGIVAASLIGVLIFGDKLGAIHLVFIAMILVGTVGLKMNLQ